jgi:hypothetical protein
MLFLKLYLNEKSPEDFKRTVSIILAGDVFNDRVISSLSALAIVPCMTAFLPHEVNKISNAKLKKQIGLLPVKQFFVVILLNNNNLQVIYKRQKQSKFFTKEHKNYDIAKQFFCGLIFCGFPEQRQDDKYETSAIWLSCLPVFCNSKPSPPFIKKQASFFKIAGELFKIAGELF